MISYNDTNAYDSRFDDDLAFAQTWEVYLSELLAGKRIEIKAERGLSVQERRKTWVQSGNMYMEYKSRKKTSGFLTTQAEAWGHILLVDGEMFCTILMNTEVLKTAINYLGNTGVIEKRPGGDDDTSGGCLVPLDKLFDSAKEIMNAHKTKSVTQPTTESE